MIFLLFGSYCKALETKLRKRFIAIADTARNAKRAQSSLRSSYNIDSFNMTHKFDVLFKGISVEGLDEQQISSMPGIVAVVEDSVKAVSTGFNWGLDRCELKKYV
jgi:hypothetical protein